MNRSAYIFLVLLLLTAVYTQWTPVVSQQIKAKTQDNSNIFTFQAGVTYTFEVTGNEEESIILFYSQNGQQGIGLFDSQTGQNSIETWIFTPAATITFIFFPFTCFCLNCGGVQTGDTILTISDGSGPVRTITTRSTNVPQMNASFKASKNQTMRVFIKNPFFTPAPFQIKVCSEPPDLNPISPCQIEEKNVIRSDNPIQTYLTATIPESGTYYLSVSLAIGLNPVYVTVELSNCFNSILDAGEQCDFGVDTEMCSACQAAPGYVCTGTAGGASSCSGYCGNAIKTFDEQCDNGNLPGCVDCLIEPGYTCEANSAGSSVCSIVPGCNNGVVEAQLGEECDNRGDVGCTDTCEIVPGFACEGSPSVCNNCGNNVVEGTEQCDGGFYCRADCRLFKCNNNGIWESGENCDNGGANGDGCSDQCFIEPEYNCTGFIDSGLASTCVHLYTCGNAVFEPFNNFKEACDNGNAEGCSQDCQVDFGWKCHSFIGYPSVCERIDNTLCGNGLRDLGENCDDGDTDNGDGCDEYCQVESGFFCPVSYLCFLASGDQCGNGYYQPQLGEGCDDGNNNDGDGCSAACSEQVGFICLADSYYLRSLCATNCGNGVYRPDEGEQCDDSNKVDGDGCSSACEVEDGYHCPFNAIGRRSACEMILHDAFCGDGYVEGDEQCDDGFFVLNQSPDGRDGCNKYCRIEFGWNCVSSNINNYRGISSCYRIAN